MRLTSSLRFRVAFAFACLGAFFSLLLVTSLYLAIQNIGHALMDQSLQAELEQALELKARGETSYLPDSVTILGFERKGMAPNAGIPPAIADLPPGYHNVSVKSTDYRMLVADRDHSRYFMLFDTDLQHDREEAMLRYLIATAILLTLASATGGSWLAMHFVTPVTRLAHQVSHAGPEEISLPLAKLSRDDEVGELARAFDHYAQRVHSFINREKQFTGDISHELRTPLAVILAAIEVLERDQRVQEFQAARIARIKRAIVETNELCTALLLLAREKTTEEDEPSYIVSDVLAECVEKHRHMIADRPIKVHVEIMGSPCLRAERALLEVVIGNLLRNAFNFTQSGSVTATLEAKRLIVRDTGIGIRSEDADRIFNLGHRGENSTGEGIGLSLVKRICDRFGWTISITSKEGEGTVAEVGFVKEMAG
jgi:signal transduction histidine kinase